MVYLSNKVSEPSADRFAHERLPIFLSSAEYIPYSASLQRRKGIVSLICLEKCGYFCFNG